MLGDEFVQSTLVVGPVTAICELGIAPLQCFPNEGLEVPELQLRQKDMYFLEVQGSPQSVRRRHGEFRIQVITRVLSYFTNKSAEV